MRTLWEIATPPDRAPVARDDSLLVDPTPLRGSSEINYCRNKERIALVAESAAS
jgi:hypothetical protein